jgi:hypothetical protein
MKRPHTAFGHHRLMQMRLRALGRAIMAERPFCWIESLAAWLTRKLTRA